MTWSNILAANNNLGRRNSGIAIIVEKMRNEKINRIENKQPNNVWRKQSERVVVTHCVIDRDIPWVSFRLKKQSAGAAKLIVAKWSLVSISTEK